MATKTWVGGTSSDVTTGANWSGGTEPAADDLCIWNSVTTYNMSGTFTNAVLLVVTDAAGWGTTTISRDVGTSASPLTLKIKATTGYAIFGNRGNVYVTASGTVATAMFEMPNGGTAVVSGGTYTVLKASAVNVEVGASAVVGTLRPNGATVTLATNATDITAIYGSGRITCNSRDIDDAVISGPSTLTIDGTSTVDNAVRLASGATFVHKGSGTVVEAELFNGATYTVSGNSSSSATLTTARLHKGSKLVEAVPGFTLTVTTKDYVGGQSTGADLP